MEGRNSVSDSRPTAADAAESYGDRGAMTLTGPIADKQHLVLIDVHCVCKTTLVRVVHRADGDLLLQRHHSPPLPATLRAIERGEHPGGGNVDALVVATTLPDGRESVGVKDGSYFQIGWSAQVSWLDEEPAEPGHVGGSCTCGLELQLPLDRLRDWCKLKGKPRHRMSAPATFLLTRDQVLARLVERESTRGYEAAAQRTGSTRRWGCTVPPDRMNPGDVATTWCSDDAFTVTGTREEMEQAMRRHARLRHPALDA